MMMSGMPSDGTPEAMTRAVDALAAGNAPGHDPDQNDPGAGMRREAVGRVANYDPLDGCGEIVDAAGRYDSFGPLAWRDGEPPHEGAEVRFRRLGGVVTDVSRPPPGAVEPRPSAALGHVSTHRPRNGYGFAAAVTLGGSILLATLGTAGLRFDLPEAGVLLLAALSATLFYRGAPRRYVRAACAGLGLLLMGSYVEIFASLRALAMQPMGRPVGPPGWVLLLPPVAGVMLAHAAFRRR